VVVPFVPAIDGRRPRVFLRMFRRNPKRQKTLHLTRIFNARDSVVQPKGWDGAVEITLAMMAATPAWFCPATAPCRNPVGVEFASVHLPRVASPSFVKSTSEGRQPWALMRNPFGIGGFETRPFEIQQSAFPSG